MEPDGLSGFACDAPIPPLTTGTHVLALAAFLTLSDGTILEGDRSAPFQVVASTTRGAGRVRVVRDGHLLPAPAMTLA